MSLGSIRKAINAIPKATTEFLFTIAVIKDRENKADRPNSTKSLRLVNAIRVSKGPAN